MRKISIVLILFLCFNRLFGQYPARLKMIICIQLGDTLVIEKYNKGKQIFWKSYKPYCNISIHKYDGNKLTNQIWFMSKEGFVIDDYTYNEEQKKRITYSYEIKDRKEIKSVDLCSTNNEDEVQKSKQFQELHQDKNKFLKEIAFYRDSFFIKKIQFNRDGDTSEIRNYTYENNLTKKVRIFNMKDNSFWDNVYSYDVNGNELQCLYIQNGLDTASYVNKKYINNLLIEEVHFRDKKLFSITKYEYSNGLIIEELEEVHGYTNKTNYFYNEDKTLKRIDHYLGWKYYYFYE